MNRHPLLLTATLAGLLISGQALADGHTEEALRRANQAAQAKGDATAIQEHTEAALRHIDAAKQAGQPDHDKLMHLLQGERNLKEALEHAKQFNTPSANEEARDAATHLEQAR
jgi:hypothetical protein